MRNPSHDCGHLVRSDNENRKSETGKEGGLGWGEGNEGRKSVQVEREMQKQCNERKGRMLAVVAVFSQIAEKYSFLVEKLWNAKKLKRTKSKFSLLKLFKGKVRKVRWDRWNEQRSRRRRSRAAAANFAFFRRTSPQQKFSSRWIFKMKFFSFIFLSFNGFPNFWLNNRILNNQKKQKLAAKPSLDYF